LPVGAEMGFFGYSYEGQGDDEKKTVWAPSLLVIMAVVFPM